MSLALHPRLTVITGVDAEERSPLSHQLADSLLVGGEGVHVEMVEDRGRSLSVFRPPGRPHRVVDTDSGRDVTAEFTVDGRIDLARRYDLAPTDLAPVELPTLESLDIAEAADIERLAGLDQAMLWSVANRVTIATSELDELAAKAGQDQMDPEVIAAVEENHTSLEAAARQLERVRRIATATAAVAVVATLPTWSISPPLGLLCAAIGMGALLLGMYHQRRVESRQRAASTALSAAGTDSYLAFLVGRVDGLFSGTNLRRRNEELLAELDDAVAAWRGLAGSTSVSWASEHRRAITAAAERAKLLDSVSFGDPENQDAEGHSPSAAAGDVARDLAERLLIRIDAARRGGGEERPLVLGDVFASVDEDRIVPLLDLIDRVVGPPQVILVAGNGPVADWARARSEDGTLSVIDVGADGEMSELAG